MVQCVNPVLRRHLRIHTIQSCMESAHNGLESLRGQQSSQALSLGLRFQPINWKMIARKKQMRNCEIGKNSFAIFLWELKSILNYQPLPVLQWLFDGWSVVGVVSERWEWLVRGGSD